MKKIIVFFSLIVAMFFSGCTLFKAGPEIISIEGILSEQPVNDEYKGTHLLTADNGLITPLNSLSLNLSAPQYLGNKVSVTGTVNSDTNVLEVTGLTVVEILSKVNGQGNLKEYNNPNYGFKLKYYNNWKIEELEGVTFFAPVDGEDPDPSVIDKTFDRAKITISLSPFEYAPTSYEDGTTDTPLAAYFGADDPNYAVTKTDISKQLRKIGPDMMDAVEMPSDCGNSDYYLYRDNFIYKISLSCNLTDSNRLKISKVFDEMISSFQFIAMNVDFNADTDDLTIDTENTAVSTDDTATSVTPEKKDLPQANMELAEFQSTSFGFKALYPKQWYYQGSNTLESGILYHYGFSDKPLDEGGTELLGLDIMSGDMPSGSLLSGYGFDGVKVSSGDEVSIYVKGENRIYRLKGAKEYEDVMLNMAAGIQKLEVE